MYTYICIYKRCLYKSDLFMSLSIPSLITIKPVTLLNIRKSDHVCGYLYKVHVLYYFFLLPNSF